MNFVRRESELKVEIMFPEQPNGNGGSTGVMRIEPLGENNFLKQIWKKKEHLGKVFLSWDVKDFGDVRGVGEKYDWKAKCEFFHEHVSSEYRVFHSCYKFN